MRLQEKELLIIRGALLELITQDNDQNTNEEEALLEKINDEVWKLRKLHSVKLGEN